VRWRPPLRVPRSSLPEPGRELLGGERGADVEARRLVAGGVAQALGIELRPGEDGPRVTDSGHYILDAHLERIPDKAAIADRLNLIPGVVENGLFVGVADEMVVGRPDGSASVEQVEKRPEAGRSGAALRS